MIETVSSTIALLAQSITARGLKSVAVTGLTRDVGVSVVSRGVAEALSLISQRVLLIDLSGATEPHLSSEAVITGGLNETPANLDVIVAGTSLSQTTRLANLAAVVEALKADLSSYDQVVLDLPPIDGSGRSETPPWRAAASAELLLLVCLRGSTERAHLAEAINRLRLAGVSRTELVLNERDYEPPAQSASRAARRIPVIGRPLARWLGHGSVGR